MFILLDAKEIHMDPINQLLVEVTKTEFRLGNLKKYVPNILDV